MGLPGFLDAVIAPSGLDSNWLALAFGVVVGFAVPVSGSAADTEPMALTIFVGTYTGGESRGIYRAQLDLRDGRIDNLGLAAELANPSFLALHPKGRWLYAVSETSSSARRGMPGGEVAAFSVDPRNQSLKLLNTQPSLGAAPCHLALDASGQRLFVANYSGGTVGAYDIEVDGKIGAPWPPAVHRGSSVHPRRQQGPHPHGAYLDPQTGHLLIPDLGLDRVLSYRVEAAKRVLEPDLAASLAVEPGAGPRHMAWHPSGRFLYVINELNSTVGLFVRRDGSAGWSHENYVSTLPPEFKGESTTAEVEVHPTGRWLYASNRGHDSLALFQIEPESGRLRHPSWIPAGGRTPRHFAISPDGRFLLVAHQDSDSIKAFRVAASGGALTSAGPEVRIPKPVCMVFLPGR